MFLFSTRVEKREQQRWVNGRKNMQGVGWKLHAHVLSRNTRDKGFKRSAVCLICRCVQYGTSTADLIFRTCILSQHEVWEMGCLGVGWELVLHK